MAKKKKKNTPHPNTKYPWDKWLNRKTRITLTKGKHYKCMTHSMAIQIRNNAKLRDISISLSTGNNSITITPQG